MNTLVGAQSRKRNLLFVSVLLLVSYASTGNVFASVSVPTQVIDNVGYLRHCASPIVSESSLKAYFNGVDIFDVSDSFICANGDRFIDDLTNPLWSSHGSGTLRFDFYSGVGYQEPIVATAQFFFSAGVWTGTMGCPPPPATATEVFTTVSTAGIVGNLVYTGTTNCIADYAIIVTDSNNRRFNAGGGTNAFDATGNFSLTGLNLENYIFPPTWSDGTYTLYIFTALADFANCENNLVCVNDVYFTTFYRTAGVWTTKIQEFQISDKKATEPSLAADPLDPKHEHAVVGFNDLTNRTPTNPTAPAVCAWAETTNGGKSWGNPDSLKFPADFHSVGDPWVRYSPTGQLFYSCVGATEFTLLNANAPRKTRIVGVFISASRAKDGSASGRAEDLGVASPVKTVTQSCNREVDCNKLENQMGLFTDHPSFDFTTIEGHIRLTVCFVYFPTDSNSTESVYVRSGEVQPNGISWDNNSNFLLTRPNQNSETCFVGSSIVVGSKGQESQDIAVTWHNSTVGKLQLRISKDGGKNWGDKVDLDSVGDLVGGSTGTTISGLVSDPYALVMPRATGGLQTVYQLRNAGQSQVFLADLPVSGPAPFLGKPTTEKFLPGGGRCAELAGAYEVREQSSGLFRYSVWRTNHDQTPIFTSGADLDPTLAYSDPNFRFPRIGDYTAVDCAGGFGWAAWTDLRHSTSSSRKPEIWGARFPLPN